MEDALLHGETLLVVTAGDAEDVALELIAEVVAGNFLAHLRNTTTLVTKLISSVLSCSMCAIERKRHSSKVGKRKNFRCVPLVDRDFRLVKFRWYWGVGTGTYSLLHEITELALILNLDQLLAAIGRVGDVQLHLGGVVWRSTLGDVD